MGRTWESLKQRFGQSRCAFHEQRTTHGVELSNDSELHQQLEAVYRNYDSMADALRNILQDGLQTDGYRRHLNSVYDVQVTLTPYKAHVIGNRLWVAGEAASDHLTTEQVQWLARRFHQKAKAAREREQAEVLVELSAFEARFVGDWLHEAATEYLGDLRGRSPTFTRIRSDSGKDERVGFETSLLRDVFHEKAPTRDNAKAPEIDTNNN